ncbi:MAG: PorT family protein [Cryomorphaceae bacterium]|nr:PorT family protein [Cryomorphaceae bacterium]
MTQTTLIAQLRLNDQSINHHSHSYSEVLYADEDTIKKETFVDRFIEKHKLDNLPYFYDDLMIVGGLNQSSLHFSNHYRELGIRSGWSLGLEGYYPILERAFLVSGINFGQVGFSHEKHDINFTLSQINIPILVAYELPVLRDFDWRIFLGTQISIYTGGRANNEYGDIEDVFRYELDDLTPFDFGFSFGLSWERSNYYLRLRGYLGMMKRFNSLHPETGVGDMGMMQTFSIEFGYLLFRPLRKF